MTEPPVAPRRPSQRTLHGVTIVDDYAWLKDEKWQQVLRDPSLLDPDIRAYLEAENRYAETLLAPAQALQKTLVAEMRGRIKEDDSGVPTPDGPFAYLWKFREGGQHQLIGRTPRAGGDVQLVLDGDALAKTSDYFKFGGTRHSPDHRLEAWSADLRGSEYFTIRVRRWDTRRGPARHPDADRRQRRLGPRLDVLLLYPGRRQPPPAEGLPAPAGHRPGRRRPRLRGEGHRLVHAHRGKRQRPLLHHRRRRSRHVRATPDRSFRCRTPCRG